MPTEIHSKHAVCLLHGLGCGPWIMAYLGRFLRINGFQTQSFKYYSIKYTFEKNVQLLREYLEKLTFESLDIVAHSLGGLLILKALELQPDARVKRIVLLGSPLQGSQYARILANHNIGKLLLGRSKSVWENMPSLSLPLAEVGLIAGGYEPRLKLRPRIWLETPNDGVVTVRETEMVGLSDFVVMPVSHSGMLFSTKVGKAIFNFLQKGKFA